MSTTGVATCSSATAIGTCLDGYALSVNKCHVCPTSAKDKTCTLTVSSYTCDSGYIKNKDGACVALTASTLYTSTTTAAVNKD